ncbi:hypothetical protein Y032_0373g195 [Ancylostoma ceylanicum]|uniref:Uncharacterized protein n=1 Tax=Ancylostoma ceylanicum TaxID=53326 RepID=A0A016RUQ1_9BILA|nr:hypothetical protein Y032_0373g195 [Ancylostoma ceylanicum]
MASTEWSTEGFFWSEPAAGYFATADDSSSFGTTSRGQHSLKRDSYSYRRGQNSSSNYAKVFHRDRGPKLNYAKDSNRTRNDVFTKGTQVRILKRPPRPKDCDTDEKSRQSTEERNGPEELLISTSTSIPETSEMETQQGCQDSGEKLQPSAGPKERRRGKGRFKAEARASAVEAASELEESSNLESKDKSQTKMKSRRRPRVEGTVPVFKNCCELINKHLGIQAVDEQRSDPHRLERMCHRCRCDDDQKAKPVKALVTSSHHGRYRESNTGAESEEFQTSITSSEDNKPRRVRKGSARQSLRERKNVKRNEIKILSRNDVVQEMSETATDGCSENPTQFIYSSQEESSNTQLNDFPSGNAEVRMESQSSQQEVMESVLHLLEMISQNPTQPTSEHNLPSEGVSAVSSLIQPPMNRSEPTGTQKSNSYDSFNHALQCCTNSMAPLAHYQGIERNSNTNGRRTEFLCSRALPARSAENVWFLPKVQELRRDLSMSRSSSWMKQNVADCEDIHNRWRNSRNTFANRWFAARVPPWENGLLEDQRGPTESFQPYLVEQRCSRSTTARRQTHDWNDRRNNVKERDVSVRSASPRTTMEPGLPRDTCVPSSDTEYSLEPTSERNANGDIDEKVVAGECGNELADVDVEAGSNVPVPIEESTELGETEGSNSKTQVNCSKEDIDDFIENSLHSLENVSFQVDRVLRVMIDFLHPDGRSMQNLLGLTSSDFYRLCSFYSRVNFERLDDLAWEKADMSLVEKLLEHVVWLCRSLMVGMLAKEALLIEDHIDFARLDLDLSYYEDLDERKEISLLFALAEDLRCIPEVQSNDRLGWFTVCEALRDIVDAFDANDRPRLRELLTAWSGGHCRAS